MQNLKVKFDDVIDITKFNLIWFFKKNDKL